MASIGFEKHQNREKRSRAVAGVMEKMLAQVWFEIVIQGLPQKLGALQSYVPFSISLILILLFFCHSFSQSFLVFPPSHLLSL